jgi:hypothetical protein
VLRDSLSIKAMLESDGSDSATSLGSSDDHPLVLRDESEKAFKCLLYFLHALYVLMCANTTCQAFNMVEIIGQT